MIGGQGRGTPRDDCQIKRSRFPLLPASSIVDSKKGMPLIEINLGKSLFSERACLFATLSSLHPARNGQSGATRKKTEKIEGWDSFCLFR